jgi:hypothetical protein
MSLAIFHSPSILTQSIRSRKGFGTGCWPAYPTVTITGTYVSATSLVNRIARIDVKWSAEDDIMQVLDNDVMSPKARPISFRARGRFGNEQSGWRIPHEPFDRIEVLGVLLVYELVRLIEDLLEQLFFLVARQAICHRVLSARDCAD